MKVSCLGPAGSFSELAARQMCPSAEIVLCVNLGETVRALLSKETDACVLPVENAISGGVGESLDLLAASDIFGVREIPLAVDHRLATLEGVRAGDIRYVYSHEQALSQCSEFLRTRLPQAQCVYTRSTSESLSRLDASSAGIVGSHVRREGVVLSPENIADNKGNFTRFLLAERRGALPRESAMVFCCAVCEHKAGSLLGLLQIFRRYSLNLTRIESRPVKETFGVYRFFVEFAGNLADARVLSAVKEADEYCSRFKLLGAYG